MDGGESELLELVPVRWLTAERLAFGIALLKSIEAPTPEQLDFVLEHFLPEDIESLPPATLEALVDLGPDKVGARIAEFTRWQRSLERLKEERGKSLIAGAKLLANRIMSGKLRSAQLIRLAQSELNCKWDNHGLAESLDELVASVSKDRTSTRQRLEALARFRVSDQPRRWSLVENALLQQSLYWPLLVLEHEDEPASALSVPVAIDVELRQPSDQSDFGKVHWYQSGLLECSDWHGVGAEALRTAKELWLHRHGSWDFGFQRSVKRASAHIDLHIAEAVIEPFREWTAEARDDSHGLYLALAFLAEFLDERAAMETTCATGSLGKRRPDPDAKDRGDRVVEMPGGVPLKIEWAARARTFDKIVVPKLPDNIYEWLPPDLKQIGGHLRICQCIAEEVRENNNMFSQAAGHVFGQSWRRHRYVRCPDLADAFRDERERKDEEPDGEVKQLLNDLRSSRSPVFVASSAVTPRTVARALYRVNDAARLDRSSRLEGYKKISSFAFIRVVDEEINERFWQVVWDVLNGSDESFHKFRFDVSRTTPGVLLANGLNKFRPRVGERSRSPDILVIVGSNRLGATSSTRISHGPFSRLRLEPIVEALRSRLGPSQIDTLKNIVGSTRIILIPEDEAPKSESNPIPTERGDLRVAAQKLSVFRYGFKYQMARHLLGERTDEVLRELMQTNGIGRPLVRYSNRAGEYYFPIPLQESSNLIEAAELHFKAADAIIGFLVSDKDRRNGATSAARFDYREAFSPAPLHEAQYHLRESWSRIGTLLGKEAYRHPVFQKARNAQERLSRMGEMFGWTHVRWATQALRQDSKDLLEALKEHLAATDVRAVHPIELVWAAKFVFRLARDHERRSPAESIKLANYDLCWRSLLDWAWLNCNQFDGGEEGAACRFVIATEHACKILSRARNREGFLQAKEHVEAALNLRPFASEILDLEWFEFLGDSSEDPASAARAYREGVWNDEIVGAHRIRYQTLIKYLGACVQAKVRDGLRGPPLFDEEIISRIKKLPRDMLEGIRAATLNDDDPRNRSGLSDPADGALDYIRERWRIGGNVFRCGIDLFPQASHPLHPASSNQHVKGATVRLRSHQTGTTNEPTGQFG